MCGIVYSQSFDGKPVNKTIMARYLKQRNRGHSGFGFYLPNQNRLTHNPREGRIMSLLRRSNEATEILYHHRMPTSTANVRNACHPFSTKDYFRNNYVLVHNGVLWNEHELKEEHNKIGIDYVSEQASGEFNDSEALTYDVARYIEGDVKYISAEGSIAFICVQNDKKGHKRALYFGRNSGNPLVMKRTRWSLTLSSEGDGEMIDPDTLYRFDYKTHKLTRRPILIPERSKDTFAYTYTSKDGRPLLGSGQDGYWDRLPQGLVDEDFSSKSYQELESDYIQWQKEDLLGEAYGDAELAIDLAEEDIQKLNRRIEKLDDRINVYQNATEDEKDEYYSKCDKLTYLKRAVDELRKEASGQSQMGFRYSPDSPDPLDDLNRFRQQPRHPAKAF